MIKIKLRIAGIDEAGRGPVIGPMVMAISYVDVEEENWEPNKSLVEKKLRLIGVKDSKKILPAKRTRLKKELKSYVKSFAIKVFPNEIDNALNSKNTNLNFLEADTTIKLIMKVKPDIVLVDCPSINTKKYLEYLETELHKKSPNQKTKIIVEHKADDKYYIVGSASIVAKVTRDEDIEELKKKYGNFGSGYMSDTRTSEFLKDNWNKYPELFRKSWSSYQKYLNQKNQNKLTNY